MLSKLSTCNKFQTPVSLRNWISFQCVLSLAYLIKKHKYMNFENIAGVYARQKSRDQF